jgi:ABC-type transport system involved in multi-copper enzyme maturation permease subunit
MTALTVTRQVPQATTTYAPASFARILGVELRKMFDTRSGAWMLASIVITSALATTAVVLWAPEEELTYEMFASAIGIPMTIVLPIIAILSVTSEWSQRTGLTTFTHFPSRGRVITAKAVCAVAVGVVAIPVAAAVGALGNVVGTAIAGTDAVWNVSAAELSNIVLANVLGLMVGFMLGVVTRSSAAAVVTYFVYTLVLPPLSSLLASTQEGFRDVQPWVDFTYAQSRLFEDGSLTGEQWAQLGTSSALWLVLPLAVGIAMVMRSEVK